jgi:hypothetical protein
LGAASHSPAFASEGVAGRYQSDYLAPIRFSCGRVGADIWASCRNNAGTYPLSQIERNCRSVDNLRSLAITFGSDARNLCFT